MKILLAPSETKQKGGEKPFLLDALFLRELLPQRKELLHKYTNILQQNDLSVLSKMFGLKKEADIRYQQQQDIIHQGTMKAIERYTGVAFDYLDYPKLDKTQQKYIDQNVILFSNLFGAIRADDFIPEYKLKQGEALGEIKVEKFYKTHSSKYLGEYLAEEEILDLRAGFYDKFYIPNKPYTSLKFIKEGKVVSHWAKAYRGIVLRYIAQNNINTIHALSTSNIKGLKLKEQNTHKNKTEIIYEIL